MRQLRWVLIQWDLCPAKKRGFWHTETPRMYTERGETVFRCRRRWPSTNQGERPQKKPSLPTPWPRTSNLHNHEKINTYCLSHPGGSILLQQLQETSTEPKTIRSEISHSTTYYLCGLEKKKKAYWNIIYISLLLLLLSHQVMSNSLWSHGL